MKKDKLIFFIIGLLLGFLISFVIFYFFFTPHQKPVRETESSQSETTKTLSEETTSTTNTVETTIAPPKMVTSTAVKEKNIGMITEVYQRGNHWYVDIDYIQFFTGDRADKEAAIDGEIAPGEDVPNDYYIRNVNPKLRTFKLDDNLEIYLARMSESGPETTTVSISIFSDYFHLEPPSSLKGLYRRFDQFPYWIYINQKNQIIRMEQQYLP